METAKQVSNWVLWVMMLAVAIVVVWDVYALTQMGRHVTVSTKIRELSQSYPILPFVFGAVIGHFFWP